MVDERYQLWFYQIPNISNMIKLRLAEALGGAEKIYHADASELRRPQILKEPEVKEILLAREDPMRSPEILMEDLEIMEISFVSTESDAYPMRLREIFNRPYGLYFRGKLPGDNQKMTAIIGARQCSSYGFSTAHEIGYLMGKTGYGVVSGMARGIDSAGHTGVLQAEGYTIAVLGCGVDICYPAENRRLYKDIIEHGCVLSEFHPGTNPIAENFPRRNRIISGLSDSVIVVEARQRSGSLITAQMALHQNREVYAVPGRMNDPMSDGTNLLIEEGAKIIPSTKRLLEHLAEEGGMQVSSILSTKKQPSLTKKEKAVYSVIDYYAKPLESILSSCDITYREVLEALYELSEKGLIRESFHNSYIRI